MPEDHVYTLGGKRWLVRFTRLRGNAIGWTFLADERNPNVNERILIDERSYNRRNRAALELLIHEAYHALNPQYDEAVVTQHSRDLARLLWGLGWRCDKE